MRQSRGITLAALGSTLVTLLAMGACRFTLGTPLLPELIVQRMTDVVTPSLLTAVIRLFGFGVKWVVFGLAVGGCIGGGVGLGWLYGGWLRGQERVPSALNGCLFGVLVWATLMTLGLPLLGAGFFGRALWHGEALGAVVWLLLCLLYGVLLGEGTRRARSGPLSSGLAQPQPTSAARRLLLGGVLVWPGLWACGLRQVRRALASAPAVAAGSDFALLHGLTPEVTPQGKFYTVSKNLFDPAIEAHTWALRVHGLVDRPLRMSLAELKALPAHQAYVTFVCISNEIGGHLLGNARWHGVRLRMVLELAGIRPEAHKAVLRSEDGYSTAVPLARCLRPETFLAYAMNDQPLPKQHGFPLRAVIPGYYGMKQPKWLTEIELVADDYQGYWESRGWADEAIVKTMSRIDVPAHRSRITQPTITVGGIAFAGERGIARVELSSDGGSTWQETSLKPALSPYAWSLWQRTLLLPREGSFLLAVRATDGQGILQDARVSEPLPDGASGYHKLRIFRIGNID